FIKKRRKLLVLVFLVLGVSSYFYFSRKSDSVANAYTLSPISKGSVFSYISGSGQVSSVNQIDIKPEVTGKITGINVIVGQEILQGDILVTIDNSDLHRKLIESQNSLAIAKNNLNLKISGATEEEKLNAKISLQNAKSSYENAVESLADAQRNSESNLKKAEQDLASSQRSYELTLASDDSNNQSNNQEIVNTYDSAETSLDSAYNSLKATIISADSILGLKYYSGNDISHYKSLLGARDSSSIVRATNDFYEAKDKIEIFEKEYLVLSKNYNYEELENLLVQIIDPLESSRDMMDSIYNALLNTITSSDFSQSQLDSLRNSASSGKSSMISAINTIKSASYNIEKLKIDSGTSDLSSVNNLENAKNSLENSKTNLEDTKINNEKSLKSAQDELQIKKYSYELAEIQYNEKVSAPDDIDLLTYRIQVSQAEANYLEAQENYNNATIISPIDGIIAQINQKVNDDASASQA
ncbi:MAG: biotin/lipoyl-binding protein, partial [Clostridia bacterium]|nr:biotin/lipoyl-binding protein [Clostridia bacterium]